MHTRTHHCPSRQGLNIPESRRHRIQFCPLFVTSGSPSFLPFKFSSRAMSNCSSPLRADSLSLSLSLSLSPGGSLSKPNVTPLTSFRGRSISHFSTRVIAPPSSSSRALSLDAFTQEDSNSETEKISAKRPRISSTSDDESDGQTKPDVQEESSRHAYDAPRKKARRIHSRVARPRDSMPGFRRSSGGGKGRFRSGGGSGKARYRNGKFGAGRGGFTNVGAKHLDRGSSAALYYGTATPVSQNEIVKEDIDVMEEGLEMDAVQPPRCSGHEEECARIVCKNGRNKGREFFKCAQKKRYEQCDFFKWVDEYQKENSKNASETIQDDDDDDIGARPCENETYRLAPSLVSASDDDNTDEGECDSVENDADTDNRQSSALHRARKAAQFLGYTNLRPGQSAALERLLNGHSVLAILPTGGGKSLIYQAYAAVTKGTVLVITPLVSLMRDQEANMPIELPCASLRSTMSFEALKEVEDRLCNGEIKVLFVSPERLFARRFCKLMKERGLNKIFSLIVLDEAHCISEWSHNFRTSYLRLPRALFGECAVFESKLSVLALTATATPRTARDICDALHMEFEKCVVHTAIKRDNLQLAVTSVNGALDAKVAALLRRLKEPPFAELLLENSGSKEVNAAGMSEEIGWGVEKKRKIQKGKRGKSIRSQKGAVIVYVSRQRDCEAVCNFIKTSSVRISRSVCMYHAGMRAEERSKVQADFENGHVGLLVATVAFGMGMNITNVRGVVHLDMPFSIESYAQEVGRAGRDGLEANCHAFISGNDAARMISRCYADGVELGTVKGFVKKLVDSRNRFIGLLKAACAATASEGSRGARPSRSGRKTKSVEEKAESNDDTDEDLDTSSAVEEGTNGKTDSTEENDDILLHIPLQTLESELDMREETAETIVALLERDIPGLHLLPSAHTSVSLQFYSRAPNVLLSTCSTLCPSSRALLQLVCSHAKQAKNGSYELSLHSNGITEECTRKALFSLQRARHVRYELAHRAVRARVCAKILKQLTASRIARVAAALTAFEKARVKRALALVNAFTKADLALSATAQSECLHTALERYFGSEDEDSTIEKEKIGKEIDKDDVKHAVLNVLNKEMSTSEKVPRTPREVARVLHGISSPAFPARGWARRKEWGAFVNYEFQELKSEVAKIIRERLREGPVR